jgi:hypothetical protein
MERKLGDRGRPHVTQGRTRLHAPAASARLAGSPASAPSGPPASVAPAPARRTPRGLLLVRYVLPATIVLAGVIAIGFGTEDSLYGGASLIAAGLSTAVISWAYRFGVQSDDERDAEAHARRYYDRFGRWPDERP